MGVSGMLLRPAFTSYFFCILSAERGGLKNKDSVASQSCRVCLSATVKTAGLGKTSLIHQIRGFPMEPILSALIISAILQPLRLLQSHLAALELFTMKDSESQHHVQVTRKL